MKLLVGIFAVGMILLALAGPFITVAALNTLFSLGIPYTVWTYLSMCWTSFVTFGGVNLAISGIGK